MNIQDARKGNGKAVLDGRVASPDNFEILRWEDEGTLVMIDDIEKPDWQPFNPVVEIRPEMNEEVWFNSFLDVTYLYNIRLQILVTARKNQLASDLFNEVIHNKNGWTRLHPKVEDVERIEIEEKERPLQANH